MARDGVLNGVVAASRGKPEGVCGGCIGASVDDADVEADDDDGADEEAADLDRKGATDPVDVPAIVDKERSPKRSRRGEARAPLASDGCALRCNVVVSPA